MATIQKRGISLLLVLVLMLGMIPSVSAAEITTEPSTEPAETTVPVTEETQAAETSPPETTQPEETSPPETTRPEETTPTETVPSETEPTEETEPAEEPATEPAEVMLINEIATFAVTDCPSATWATIWVNTDEYSSVAGKTNRFIYYEFPSGTAKNRNNVGLKAIKVDGAWQAAYCLEPGIAEGSKYNTEEMTKDEFLSSSYVPDTLSTAQLEAMCIAALYGQHTLPQSSNYEDLSNMVATQIIIWEIAIGWRDCYPPYAQTNDAFIRRFKHAYGVGPEATSSYITIGGRLQTVIDCYDEISANMAAHDESILSFASRSSSRAPTIELIPDGTGKYTATVTDTNGVLSDFSFTNTSSLKFTKNGNKLTITASAQIKDVLVAPTKEMADANNHIYFVWHNGSYQVMLATPTQPSYDPIPAYFYVTTPDLTASLDLTKTTEDGKNLSGWKFGIYSDSGCTNLISGPHTTDANGKIDLTDLTAGTVYVKELGHNDSSINALYSCSSTNPQKVVLTAGETAKISFHNKLNTGSAKLVKQTNTGENLNGWKIGLYFDAACTNAVSGSPFTTGTDGSITVTGLKPGTLYAKEISTDDPYWEFDTSVKEVKIVANQTATVTFTNTHYGRIQFQKTTNTGNHLGGWTFRVTDADGNHIGDYTTDETGTAYTENLPAGRYTVVELSTDDNYWNCELGFHDVTVKAGETAVDKWVNREQGLGWFYKTTNTGETLSDWEITVYNDEACTNKVCTVTTGENGKIGYYLDPGIYYAKETGDSLGRFEDEYWLVDNTVYKFEIKPHEETSVTFSNTHYGKLNIRKTMDTEGPLDGWKFRVTDASGKEITGSPFTSDKNGEIDVGNILPGVYKIEELLPEDSLYYCKSENPQTVTVKQGETAEVTFANALRPGKITIEKLDLKGEHLSGAKFLLEWSEDGSLWWPIEYSDSKDVIKGFCSNHDVVDGALTTTDSGIIAWNNLHPGLYYRITELEAPEGYSLLTEAAYEGKLPVDDVDIVLQVVNCEEFTLPKTGSASAAFFRISSILCAAICVTLLIVSYRKKRR